MKILIMHIVFTLGAFLGVWAQQWVEVWSDEFNYEGLPDSTRWSYDVGGDGWGNGELQYYTKKRLQNAQVTGGNLVITARKEDYEGNAYTSARLVSKNKGDWLYGRIEVRAKLPSGRGIWPAIWMLPTNSDYGVWPRSGEIDIMEYVGWQPDTIHGTVHTQAFNHNIGTQKGELIQIPDCEEQFHVYALEWSEQKIEVFVDDISYFTFDNSGTGDYREWPFDRIFHLLLNVAVGGSWGGLHDIDDSIFPQSFLIDYVRVFKPDTAGPFLVETPINGRGSVVVSPSKGSYDLLDTVIIKAYPDEGYEFKGWAGDITSTSDSLHLVMTRTMFLTPYFAPPNHMLINGDFTSLSYGWEFVGTLEGASSSGRVQNEAFHIDIENGGTVDYAIQLNRPGLSFVKAESYRVSFDAKADAPRSIKTKINQATQPWRTYHSTEHEITSRYENYSFEFTMEDTSDRNARVEFDLGLSDIDVYIDNVEVIRLSSTGVRAGAQGNTPKVTVSQLPHGVEIRFDQAGLGKLQASIYNLNGRLISRAETRQNMNGGKLLIKTAELPRGTLILKIQGAGAGITKVLPVLK